MTQSAQIVRLTFALLVSAFLSTGLLAAPAPAGQSCPKGAFVIGFDSGSNIICSAVCGNGVTDPGETCDDGNTVSGDACPASCQSATPDSKAVEKGVAVQAVPSETDSSPSVPAATHASGPAEASNIAAQPVVSRIRPWKLTYGSREVTITVTGSGFGSSTIVIFQGKEYAANVSQQGTSLSVTLATRNLDFGAYAITISNGPGMETTSKKALQIY